MNQITYYALKRFYFGSFFNDSSLIFFIPGKLGGDLHYTSDNSVGDCSCTCSIYSFIRYSKTFLFVIDNHEAEVQVLVLTYGRDMAHCSRCLIPCGSNDGKYMMEIHRVLKPGTRKWNRV